MTPEPVLVAGGGPVGLVLAVELGTRGIPAIVFECRSEVEAFPGLVNITNSRSMTQYRRWGLAAALRANDPVGPDVGRNLTFVTRLDGHVILNLESVLAFPEAPPVTPEPQCWLPLPGVDRTLREAVASLPGVEVRWGTTVEDLEQHDGGVEIRIAGPGGADTVKGSYLVVATGRQRDLVDKLELDVEHGSELTPPMAWHFHAPGLEELFGTPLSSATFFLNEDRHDDALIAHGDDHWLYTIGSAPAGLDGDDWESVKGCLFSSVGTSFETTPIGGGVWPAQFRWVSTPALGRIFLAGDAAHYVPVPGWGMNMGIADAVDLGWKLAATLEGWGGPELLDSYAQERGQVVRTQIDAFAGLPQASVDQMVEEHMEDDGERGEAARGAVVERIMRDKLPELMTAGLELGVHFDASPLVVPDGSQPPAFDIAEYTPSARPGHLAPHMTLPDGRSLYDCFGPWFTLLVLDSVDVIELERAAAEAQMPLTVVDLSGASPLRNLYESRLAVVRPDQHVAWRADEVPANPSLLVARLIGANLGDQP